jgi:8-oxo-dGTP pyrophosphatase MutT (NUDIX family)
MAAPPVEPLRRHAARVIVIDAQDRVLMLRGGDPARPHKVIWHTPGGGVEDGEDEVLAARRELFEETGLAADHVVGPVWVRRLQFSFDNVPYDQSETFYVTRVDSHEVDTSGHTDLERRYLSGHRWWSVAELRGTDELLAPPDMADRLDDLLSGRVPYQPAAPVVVGGAVLP